MLAPVINPGRRVLAAGKTGSGKSTWACWMMENSRQKWIILNPKHTAAYNDLENSIVVNTLDISKWEKELKKYKYIIVNPTSGEAGPDELDAFVMRLHNSYSNIGLCCDELYSMHKNGVAGQGLIGWLTRGRELKQSFLGLTQRPAWISKFLYSEADYICAMKLALKEDKKKLVEMTDKTEFNYSLQPHYWLWYSSQNEKLVYFAPVPLDA